jgi:pentatricopeptide repeat protein
MQGLLAVGNRVRSSSIAWCWCRCCVDAAAVPKSDGATLSLRMMSSHAERKDIERPTERSLLCRNAASSRGLFDLHSSSSSSAAESFLEPNDSSSSSSSNSSSSSSSSNNSNNTSSTSTQAEQKVYACLGKGQLAKVLQLLRTMQQRRQPASKHLYNSALRACCKSERFYLQARDLIACMRAHGLNPSPPMYIAAMLGYAQRKRWHDSLALLHDMKASDVKLTAAAYNAAVAACGEGGQVKQALALVQEMQKNGLQPTLVTYNAVLRAASTSGSGAQGMRVLQQMVREGVLPDVSSYNLALQACTTQHQQPGKQVATALQLLDSMQQQGVEPNAATYSTAVAVCSKAEQWESLLVVLTSCTPTVCSLQQLYSVLQSLLVCRHSSGAEPAICWQTCRCTLLQQSALTATSVAATTLLYRLCVVSSSWSQRCC